MSTTPSPRPRRTACTSRAASHETSRRIERLRLMLREQRVDALLVVRQPNIEYLSGFAGHDSVLLVGRHEHVVVTDFRYEEEAAVSAPGFPVAVRHGTIAEEVARQVRKKKWRSLAFEANGMLVSDQRALASTLRKEAPRGVRLRPSVGMVEALRVVKSPSEVEAIRTAIGVAERAGATAQRNLARGIREVDIARSVARRMEDLGASGTSFDTIAALDARSSMPHARSGPAVARANSFLLLDWGARVDSYCSDLTRMYTQHSIPAWLRTAHAVVLEAQRAAIECVGPGVRARDVDAAARDVLRKAGWDRLFGHGVGHGLGLEIHEAPRLGPRSTDVLRQGMVVTIEPGVYFPGRGGVRIEDDVLVTETGAEVLSSLPRALD
jgi:Xaa-Pro aminopeptidase